MGFKVQGLGFGLRGQVGGFTCGFGFVEEGGESEEIEVGGVGGQGGGDKVTSPSPRATPLQTQLRYTHKTKHTCRSPAARTRTPR